MSAVADPNNAVASRSEATGTKHVLLNILEQHRGEWSTVEELTEAARGLGWGQAYDDPGAVVRTALRRLTGSGNYEVQRERIDGRSWRYRVPALQSVSASAALLDAESPAGDAAGLSDLSDQTPEGGEHTDGQGSHHVHRDDLAGRNGDRDHLGAPVGH